MALSNFSIKHFILSTPLCLCSLVADTIIIPVARAVGVKRCLNYYSGTLNMIAQITFTNNTTFSMISHTNFSSISVYGIK